MTAPPSEKTIPVWNPRGSEWHRWDPHIHAPGTVLEDGFGDDWDGYFTKVETATPAIRALGITDYYSIDTYRRVREFQAKGRLAGVPFIFPNVEMRLNVKTTRDRGINIHLLFSPDDPNHEKQIDRILSGLTFDYGERDYRCSRSDLVALGKRFDPSQTADDAAFRVGVNQFKVSFADLRNLFRRDAWLRENCLIAVAAGKNDGTSGLQGDDAFAATREELQRFASVILSGNPADREFWLGRKPGTDVEAIEQKYGHLKPCIHGCDAHNLEAVATPDLDRFCWLKGDLAFETLRQLVIEPEERVWLGEQSPDATAESIGIANLQTEETPWLEGNGIEFNRGLVSVIGSRGSGKTALADMIAAGAHSLGALGESSFLLRATSPDDLIGAAKVTEIWNDGSTTSASFRPPKKEDDDEPEDVRYLSQHFVNKLCSSAGLASELRNEIERVIFDQTSPMNRYEADSFETLSERILRPIIRRREQQADAIHAGSDKIAEEERLRDLLPKLRKEHGDVDVKIKRSELELRRLVPKGKEERAKRLFELEEAYAQIEARIEGLNRRQKTLDGLLGQVKFVVEQSEPYRFSEMQAEFAETKLQSKEWDAFRMQFYGDVTRVIDSAKKAAFTEAQTLTDGDPKAPVDKAKTPLAQWPLVTLRSERDQVKKEVGADIAVQKRYDTLKRSIAADQTVFKRLAVDIKKAEGAEERRTALITNRRDAYRNVFQTFSDEEVELRRLYEPLHESIADAKGALSKLRFVVKRHIRLKDWVDTGEDLLDLRKEGRFRGHGALYGQAARTLATTWRSGEPEDVATAMQEFVKEFRPDILNAKPKSLQPEERLKWLRDIGRWLYSVDHISIEYAIEYDGVAVEQLSPGTRGIVLLLLYLAIDRADRRPLLIDQPEENLDPKSVFDDLVPHFREARKRRQVIIVTHNANLVVNTDADQVIIATCAPGSAIGLPRIKYESGSLENPTVRAAVCDILEGGRRAFLERERRYRLHWRGLLEELGSEPPSVTAAPVPKEGV